MAAGRHLAKISNGDISATDHPIDFEFDPTVGFSGTADRMALFPVSQIPRWRLAAILEISNGHISGMSYRIHFHELQSGVGVIQEKMRKE